MKIKAKIELVRGDGNTERRHCFIEGEFNAAEDCLTALILESPDATRWRVKVDNSGILITEVV